MTKRLLALVLTLAMVLSFAPVSAFAIEPAPTLADFEGKKVSILGDSISTFDGVSNNPEYNSTIGDNHAFYLDGSLAWGSGGMTLHDTWWQQVIDALGMELCVNNSYTGTKGSGRLCIQSRT